MRRPMIRIFALMACLSLAACDHDNPEETRDGPLSADAPAAMRTCTADADCILVSSTCIGCCDRTSVDRADSAAYLAFRNGACRNSPTITCGCCQQAAKASCLDGLCTMEVLSEGCP